MFTGTSIWDKSTGMFICETPTYKYLNMVVSHVDLIEFTLEPRVDQLAMITITLADSTMMTQ